MVDHQGASYNARGKQKLCCINAVEILLYIQWRYSKAQSVWSLWSQHKDVHNSWYRSSQFFKEGILANMPSRKICQQTNSLQFEVCFYPQSNYLLNKALSFSWWYWPHEIIWFWCHLHSLWATNILVENIFFHLLI